MVDYWHKVIVTTIDNKEHEFEFEYPKQAEEKIDEILKSGLRKREGKENKKDIIYPLNSILMIKRYLFDKK